MKIAVYPTTSVGKRALRVLQSEPAVVEAVAWGIAETPPRTKVVDDLRGYSVLVTDTHDLGRAAEAAAEAGISLVSNSNEGGHLHEMFAKAGLPLVMGANLSAGIAPALAYQETSLMDEPLEVRLAWTVMGRRRRKGEPIPFPGPVGSQWATPTDAIGWTMPSVPVSAFAAALDGPWAAAMAQVSGAVGEGVQRTIVGTADDRDYLAAIALAAAAVPTARETYDRGHHWASEAALPYLDRALAAGLDVASFHETTAR